MHVYIMRHGEAAPEAASDALRPLTLCGRDETQQMAHWLSSQNPGLKNVFVSPYLRAQQTSQVMSKTLIHDEPVVMTLAMLTPDGDAREIADYLHRLAVEGVTAVLLVSHLPLVGYLVSALCPQECPPMFATAGIACIDYSTADQRGQLCWQISPSKLAKAM